MLSGTPQSVLLNVNGSAFFNGTPGVGASELEHVALSHHETCLPKGMLLENLSYLCAKYYVIYNL